MNCSASIATSVLLAATLLVTPASAKDIKVAPCIEEKATCQHTRTVDEVSAYLSHYTQQIQGRDASIDALTADLNLGAERVLSECTQSSWKTYSEGIAQLTGKVLVDEQVMNALTAEVYASLPEHFKAELVQEIVEALKE